MQPITYKTSGILYKREASVALLLDESGGPLYLRFALVTQGPEEPVFPAFLLDDWGKERKDLGLYEWIYEEGYHFPRANLFALEADGRETQLFLRELEIYFKYPCFAYARRKAPVAAGDRVSTIILPDPDHSDSPQKAKAPSDWLWPLRRAAVRWRRANPGTLAGYGYEPYSSE